jgi:Domain of unknown function (DUF4082)
MPRIIGAGISRWAVLMAATAAMLLLLALTVPPGSPAHPVVSEAGNVAPSGTTYRWSHNRTDTLNANRVAESELNDEEFDIDVRLNGSRHEPATAYEAAGVIWTEARLLDRVDFVNGSWEGSGDGAFCAELKLQATTDGVTWSDTGWTVDPAYAYDSSAAGGSRHSFRGTPINALGVRVSGKIRCTQQGSYWANVSELLAFDAPPIVSLWDDATTPEMIDAGDASAVELGVRFRAEVDGQVTALRFYKAAANGGTHVGTIWRAADQARLGRVTFTGESASGWQQATLAEPVDIHAGVTYVASYHTTVGHYSVSPFYFAVRNHDAGLLEALRDGLDGGNGLYQYSSQPTFPGETYNAGNYWVDVVFNPGAGRIVDEPPTAPTQLQGDGSQEGGVSLTWAASSDDVGVARYEIHRDGAPLAETTRTTYLDSSAVADATYRYTVRAVDTADQPSPFSNETTVTYSPETPPSDSCTQVSQYGITFRFDQAYPCGTFATGDWWVAPAEGLDRVTVTAITPDATTGRNGFEVNPSSADRQGFDSRARDYDASLVPSLPLAAAPGSSIVKEVSLPSTADGCGGEEAFISCIDTGAVLTVLGAVPADRGAGHFRPAYFGTEKPLVPTSQLRLDALPQLAPVAGAPSLAEVADWYRRPQIDHQSNWHGGLIHPRQNLPYYGRDLANRTSDAALRLMLDDPAESKREAAIAYVQYGLDLAAARAGGTHFGADGGWRQGRKLVLGLSAELLDDEAMRALVRDAPDNSFSEDGQLYRSAVDGRVLWGAPCSADRYWRAQHLVAAGGQGDCRDPYGYIDGGLPGVENGDGGYQYCCTAGNFMQAALALHLLPELQCSWSENEVFLEYADRWFSFGAWTQEDPYAPLGDGALDTNPLDGTGRYPRRHGSGGGHSSWAGTGFGAAMWDAYRSGAGQPVCGLSVPPLPGA